MKQTFRLGAATIDLHDGYTVTTFDDGCAVCGRHDEQPGQEEIAERCLYPSPEELNREHDIVHSLLAVWLGLDRSPALHAVAAGGPDYPFSHYEEAAVLSLQTYARLAGVDLIALAARQLPSS